jgi:hypothetical protein
LLKSYNIPEFVTGKIPNRAVIASKAKDAKEKRKSKFEIRMIF